MTKFNRSQFSATPVKTLEREEDRVNEITRHSGFMHKIEEGDNVFRLFPALPGDKSYVIVRVVHWLPRYVDDPKGESGDKIWKRMPVPDARIHGSFSIDPVAEYKDRVYVMLKEDKYTKTDAGRKEAKRIWNDIITLWSTGLRSNKTWICYASKQSASGWSDPKILEFKKSVQIGLENASITTKKDAVDPFTDPDTGRPVLIRHDTSEKDKKEIYKVSKQDEPVQLTDEQLLAYLTMPTLEFLYGGDTFTKTDFENIYEGLEHFDEEHELGVFNIKEWQDLDLSEFYSRWEEAADVNTGEVKEDVKEEEERFEMPKIKEIEEAEEVTEEVVEDVVEEVVKDHLTDLDRNTLKIYIRDNKLGVKVFKSFSDDVIRDKIREVESANMRDGEASDLDSMRADIKKSDSEK